MIRRARPRLPLKAHPGMEKTHRTRRRSLSSRGRELQLFRGIFSLARGNACRIDVLIWPAPMPQSHDLQHTRWCLDFTCRDPESESRSASSSLLRASVMVLSCISSTTASSRDRTTVRRRLTHRRSTARESGRPPAINNRDFLCRDDLIRFVGRFGCEDHLGENLGDCFFGVDSSCGWRDECRRTPTSNRTRAPCDRHEAEFLPPRPRKDWRVSRSRRRPIGVGRTRQHIRRRHPCH